MMKKQLLGFGVLAVAATMTSQAALVWHGTNNTFFSESNWTDNEGGTPAANTINGNVDITASTGGLILFDASTGGTSASAVGNHIRLGAGNDLQVGDGLTLGTTGTNGMSESLSGSGVVDGTIIDGSTVNVQFTGRIDWTLDGASTIRLRGGTNPINTSTIDFLDTGSQILLTNETVADFTSEHLGKVFVNGAPAVIGTNISAVGDGGSGSIITVIPEPSAFALLGLGGFALLRRRRS